jgi:hypothetical protein
MSSCVVDARYGSTYTLAGPPFTGQAIGASGRGLGAVVPLIPVVLERAGCGS